MDAGCTPKGVWRRASAGSAPGCRHPRAADPPVAAATSTPSRGEAATMPAHDGVGRDDLDSASPVWPQPRQPYPQPAIGAIKPGSRWRLALEDGELMPEREDLRLEL